MRKIKQTVRTILLCGFLFAYTDATFAQITLSVKQQPVREVIKEIERISDYRSFKMSSPANKESAGDGGR